MIRKTSANACIGIVHVRQSPLNISMENVPICSQVLSFAWVNFDTNDIHRKNYNRISRTGK